MEIVLSTRVLGIFFFKYMDKQNNIIPITKGIEKLSDQVEAGIARLMHQISRLEETQVMILGWILSARADGDMKSVALYEAELADINSHLEGAKLHIEHGREIVDDLEFEKFQRDMKVFEKEMRTDILEAINEELEMTNGLIAFLETFEALTPDQERELVELQNQKGRLESDKSKYE